MKSLVSVTDGFQWLDGTAVGYTNWRPGEPSTRGWGGNIENCMEIFLSDGKWNDEDCDSKRMYVCEKQMGKWCLLCNEHLHIL